MNKPPHLMSNLCDTRLRLLRIYKTVVESNGFSGAEIELNISRSAISIAISDLEHYLGVSLCQRGRAGFSLTEEGAQVYDATLQLFSALEGFKTQMSHLHTHLRGELQIGITDNMVTMPQMSITHALRELKIKHNEVHTHIHMMPPYKIELQVLDNRLHIGVVPGTRVITGLEYTPLYEETCLLYCSQDHHLFHHDAQTLKPHILRNQEAVLPDHIPTSAVNIMHGLKKSASAADREGVAFLLLTGQYIGFLPTHFAKQWVDIGALKPLLPEVMGYSTHYSIIKNRRARPHLVRDTYLQLLKNHINKPL